MRGSVLCVMLALAAGCAEAPVVQSPDGGDDPAGGDGGPQAPDGTATEMGLQGQLVAVLQNSTVQAGVPFNVTLALQEAAAGNGTGSDGTGGGSNATGADAPDVAWLATFANATSNVTYNGTGLPATFQANLSLLGGVTMTASATRGNTTLDMAPLMLDVQAAVTDPCAGIGVQERVTFSGSNLAPGDTSDHVMELLPCQAVIRATISMSGGTVDNDWWLYDPAGTQQGSGTSFGIRTENPITVDDQAKLVPGPWTFRVENFAGAAAGYTITVDFV